MDAMSRTFLGVGYAFKGTVDHTGWAVWPLSVEQLDYAASDACILVDVLLAITRRAEAFALAGVDAADPTFRGTSETCEK